MKKLFTLFALVLCLTNLKAQFVTIPDANFVTWLQTNVASAMIGNQMDTTSLAVTLKAKVFVENLGITDLTGIQYFDSLKTLDCGNGDPALTTNSNTISSLPNLPSTLDTLICGRNAITSLPILPITLKDLRCYSNQLTSLPLLPNGLRDLDCSFNPITNLPSLPNTLLNINCAGNSLSNILILPNSLITLNCSFNQLTNLPILPNSMTELYCGYNQLSTITSLPDSLKYFECYYNSLTNISYLPSTLIYMDCLNNLLSSIPSLPNTLLLLSCSNNQLTSLPTLPNQPFIVDCSNNNINCFNLFDLNLTINLSNNPITCLPNYIPSMDAATLNYPLCSPSNINGCPTAGGIVGFTYKDNDNDCLKNVGDNGLKNIPLQLYSNTGTLLGQTYSALNGIYQFPQTANTYTVAIDTTGLPFTSSCIFPGLDSIVTVATLDTNINFALICKPGFDVGVQSISTNGIIFPGQNHVLNVSAGDITQWYNLNCASGVSGIVSFSVNGPVTYVGHAVGALTPIVAGNVYTYNITDFGTINNSTDFQLFFQTNTTAQAGDVICVNATVTPISGDKNPINNTYTFCYNVVNSYDPNIKETYPENVQPGFNDWLTYTIHFQNTGNAPAFNIRLADTLDAMLDLETFQVINYSHQNLIDLTGNVLIVRFPNIQLPDSTTNSAGSKGFIQYRIKPKATWVAPYQIKNTAYIYFDYNAPIVTNTTLNTILIPTGLHNQTETLMNLYPNPSNGNFTIDLNTKEKQTLQVFDITGNVVISQTIENGKTIIDGSHLASGIYNINIKGNNSVANKKLVIVK